jgi:hypothetical protein
VLLIVVMSVFPRAAAGQTDDALGSVARALELAKRAQAATEPERIVLVRQAQDVLAERPELSGSNWLHEPLNVSSPDLEQAIERLSAVQATLQGRPADRPNTEAARALLDRILAGPPFAGWSWLAFVPALLLPLALLAERIAELIWNAMRWPFDRILDLLNYLFEGLFFTPAVLVLALIATIGLVWLYRRGLRSAIVAEAEIAAPRGDLPPTSAEALAAAQACASAGEFRDACHFVFLSTLLWIEEQGRARFVPAATNREYLAQIAAQPRVSAALGPVVNRFDRIWYGQDSVGDADYQDLLAAATRLREAAA